MTTRRKSGTNALQGCAKLGIDSRFFALNEAYRSRVTARSRLRLRWKHTVLSTLSKLSESKCIRALRYSSRLLVAVRLIWRIKSTGLYALSQITLWRSLKCVMQFQAQSKRSCKSIRSPPMVIHRMKKKNRESQWLRYTQLFKHTRGLGDSWSNSIRAAADTK